MGTIVAYSANTATEVETLPLSPVPGTQVILSGFGETFVFQNGLWAGVEGGSYLLSYTGGVAISSAVVIINETARLANALTHTRCDGICIGTFDGKALIRTSGFAACFEDLDDSSNYYLGTTSGTIVGSPEGGNTVLVGAAVSSTTLLLKLGVGVTT